MAARQTGRCIVKRIFLIGNGASLKETNLDLLVGLDCMTVNKSNALMEMFPRFDPKFYVKIDYSPFDKDDWKQEVLPHVERGETCLLWDAFRKGAAAWDGNHEYIQDGIGDFENVRYIPRCKHHYARTADWHSICTGLNSIVTMVIWAVQMQYSEIVLVGCDGLFTTPDRDHYTEDYYKNWDADYANRNNSNILMAHAMLSKYCPVPVYDATVNGHLDFYPKVRLEDVCQKTA